MKFSTQCLLSFRESQTHAEVHANTIEECRLADLTSPTSRRSTS